MANPWYIPSNKLQQVHSWARPNAADSMHDASNVIQVTWDTPAGKNYIEGITSVSAWYFVIGSLLFLTFMFVNTLACCCRAKALAKRKMACCEGFFSCLFNPTAWFVLSVVVMIALNSAAIANLTNFKSAVDTTVTSLNGIDNLLSKANNQVNGNLTTSLNAVDSGLAALLATAQANNAPQTLIDQITAMQGQSSSAILYTTETGSQLNTTVNTFNNGIGGGKLDAHQLSSLVYVGSAAVLGLFLIFLLFVSLTTMKTTCCASTFRFCNFITLISFLLVFIFAGLMLLSGMVGSDACVNPADTMQKLLNNTMQNTQGGSYAASTVQYYITCQNQDGSVNAPTAGAAFQLQQGQQQFSSLQTSFQSFAQANGQNPTYSSDVAAVNGALATTQASWTQLNAFASCLPINTVWQNLEISLCNTGVAEGLLNIWALSTAACVIMLILTTAASALCWSHRGDPVLKDGQHVTVLYSAAQGKAPQHPAGPATVGSAANYTALPSGPSTAASGNGGSAGAYASEWK